MCAGAGFLFLFLFLKSKNSEKKRLRIAFFFFEVFSVILAWVAVCLFIGACVLAVGILWGMFA